MTKRAIHTRFPFGYNLEGLSLAIHEQLAGSLCKRHAVTPSEDIGLPLLVSAIGFQVLFHSPNRGTFQYSLALLLHYRSPRNTVALAGWAPRIQTRFHVTGPTRVSVPEEQSDLIYGAVTLYCRTFQTVRLSAMFL